MKQRDGREQRWVWHLKCKTLPPASLDGKLEQFVVSAVKDVKVNLFLDARQLSGIAVLPEGPRTTIAHAVDVVMGYPVGVEVEDGVVHVLLMERVVGVDDGLHLVVLLYPQQPFQDALTEILEADVGWLHLYVEHWGQVALFQLHVVDEMLGLALGGR